jgi:GNAT superfamily N-acetyltransferase
MSSSPDTRSWWPRLTADSPGSPRSTRTCSGHLYVHPDLQGRGIGDALLTRAKELRPDGFRLWVFQRNTNARRFYEHRGLRLVELTDGEGNEEREPDALYEWRPG